jgi:hypothetical protein
MLTKKLVFVKRNKQMSATSPCLSNLPPLVEVIHTLVISRSEEELLVGHESSKA